MTANVVRKNSSFHFEIIFFLLILNENVLLLDPLSRFFYLDAFIWEFQILSQAHTRGLVARTYPLVCTHCDDQCQKSNQLNVWDYGTGENCVPCDQNCDATVRVHTRGLVPEASTCDSTLNFYIFNQYGDLLSNIYIKIFKSYSTTTELLRKEPSGR